jgi:hypothetical protein
MNNKLEVCMVQKHSLEDNREIFRDQVRMYRALPELLLDGIGALLIRSKLPPNASTQEEEGFPSYWINGILLGVLTFAIGRGISMLLYEQLKDEEIAFTVWASAMGALSLIVSKVNIRALLNTFYGPLLDRMQRSSDIVDLGNWLKRNFRFRLPLVFGFVLGPTLAVLLYNSWGANHGNLACHVWSLFGNPVCHIGSLITLTIACMQAMWVGYYLFPFYLMFPPQLHRYQFDLYAPDPSSSEVVGRLSQLLAFILYVTMAFIIQLMIGLGLFNVLSNRTVLTGFVISLLVISPMVIMYAAGQYHLSDVIVRAKWKILNEVQTKIEELSNQEEIPDKETLDRLSKLMDYHDRIKSTPNSALNLRVSLNFLNSLLLPILAFVLANYSDVVQAITGKAPGR